ncbi:hypothetical protein PO909_023463 [Leuciscus waleckii]
MDSFVVRFISPTSAVTEYKTDNSLFFAVLSFFCLFFSMDIPAVALLCLEQKDCSLESHTRDFFELSCLMHYPDCSLCVFYIASLSRHTYFATCVEWVLVNNNSEFTISLAEPTNTPPPNAESRPAETPFQSLVLSRAPCQILVLSRAPFQSLVLSRAPFQSLVPLRAPFQSLVPLRAPFQSLVPLRAPFQSFFTSCLPSLSFFTSCLPSLSFISGQDHV